MSPTLRFSTLDSVLLISLVITIAIGVWVISRHLSAARQAKAALITGQEYRTLADEHRQLGDASMTVKEHTGIRLTDISVRVDALRDPLARIQHILMEAE